MRRLSAQEHQWVAGGIYEGASYIIAYTAPILGAAFGTYATWSSGTLVACTVGLTGGAVLSLPISVAALCHGSGCRLRLM